MNTKLVTDDVTDGIAYIEMHRQIAATETGLAVACSDALRKLHQLLDGERAALEGRASAAGRSANLDAVTDEIEKVKKLVRAANGEGPGAKQLRPRQHQAPRQNARPAPAGTKGRRTMGRSGER